MKKQVLVAMLSVIILSVLITGCGATTSTQPAKDSWKQDYDSKAMKINGAIKLLDAFIEKAEQMGIEGTGLEMNEAAKNIISSMKGMTREARNITPKIPDSASKDKVYQYQNLNDLANNTCDLINSAIDNVAVGNVSIARSVSDQAKASLRHIDYMYDTIIKKM